MTEYLFEVEPNDKHLTGVWIEALGPRQAAIRAARVCAYQKVLLKSLIPKRIGMELNPKWLEALTNKETPLCQINHNYDTLDYCSECGYGNQDD